MNVVNGHSHNQAPTWASCPLFIKRNESDEVGECHRQLESVAVPKQQQPNIFSPNQPGKTEVIFLGGWTIVQESSLGCASHPAIAAHMALCRDEYFRSNHRRGRKQ